VQERREPFDVVLLARHEREGERTAFADTARVDFGREATARAAEGILILSPLFSRLRSAPYRHARARGRSLSALWLSHFELGVFGRLSRRDLLQPLFIAAEFA
jgi:hypothetical protein